MKKIALMSFLMLAVIGVRAETYIQSPLLGGKVYFSQGATFMTSDLKYDQAFTNVSAIYHPLSAGSLTEHLPPSLQPFFPPEAWACTVGGGYLAAKGGGTIGVGCGFNLLDSARSYASRLLNLTNNATAAKIAKQIAPSDGPLNLYVGRQENISFGGKFVPRWFFGAAFGF